MIYANKSFVTKVKNLKFGELYCIELGDEGKGKKI